jgi:Xaa-Pro aminopeptidase
LLEACLEAQQVGLELIKPGARAMAVVDGMKEVVARYGFADWDWTTGHGFGMDIAEEPFFFPSSTTVLEPGMSFYIEPMIIPTHMGTACIEDMVLVTDTGYEELTASPEAHLVGRVIDRRRLRDVPPGFSDA